MELSRCRREHEVKNHRGEAMTSSRAARRGRRGSVALFIVIMATVAACGGGTEPRSSPATSPSASSPDSQTEPGQTATTAVPASIQQYLLQSDELPGLEPVQSPQTLTGEPFDLPKDGAALLRRSGYISTTYQPAVGDTSAGVSSVMLFGTEAGARDWMAYETSEEAILHQVPNTKIKRFRVLDVPGARGWTGHDLHGNAIGHVYWTEGRCMLLIGLEVEGPRVERLSAGAAAIYERTGGTCPD